jgi:hypothetical protein
LLSFGAETFAFQFAFQKNIKIRIYKTVIFPLVLYGCETWSLNLRKKHRLRMFENGVLKKIFWPKSDEVTREWGKLHNEEIYDTIRSPDHQILFR